MRNRRAIWQDPEGYLRAEEPDQPVWFFAPDVLRATAARFRAGFPGLVTYAVKANDSEAVLENLAAAGVAAFDVASPAEMARVRRLLPGAVLHYNNPVRSRAEITQGVARGVLSWSVDDAGELAKLVAACPRGGTEIAVRLKLPVAGAAYDFGSKFGATPEAAADLLRAVAGAGFVPAMTFHPGTQCTDPAAWAAYVRACADVVKAAGVRLARLNVGGGFPAARSGAAVPLEVIFAAIGAAVAAAFGEDAPALVCEPGRAMVAGAWQLALRVKSRRPDAVYLNDGIYGGLSEAPVMPDLPGLVRAIGAEGARSGPVRPFVVFGPTCDSLDRLPGTVDLPGDLDEGDWLIFAGMGAYAQATATGFNGYGLGAVVTLAPLPGAAGPRTAR